MLILTSHSTWVRKSTANKGSDKLNNLSMADSVEVQYLKLDIEQQSNLTTNTARQIFNEWECSIPLCFELSVSHR